MVSNSHEEEEQVLLQDKEWERQQIKSFTLWINSHLRKQKAQIEDIQKDLRDGKNLLKLLEVISGEHLPKAEKGNLRVHHVNNVNRCLEFIARKGVRLAGIGSEEIVDGNLKMTLGMVWTIILRFAICNIGEGSFTAKDGLLLWVKKKTEGYKGVNVVNFTTSFKDGLVFCALIHRHRPELMNYSALKKEEDMHNLNHAFDVAEKDLDIPRMLDAEDMRGVPDEKSVMTYVSCYYHAFSSSQQVETAAKRISKILDIAKDNQAKMEQYERLASDLMDWINRKIPEMEERPEGDPSLEELLARRKDMDKYKSGEKPAKAGEKAKLESLLNTLKTKLHLSKKPEYLPPEGLNVKDISDRWKELELQERLRLEWLNTMLQKKWYMDHLLKKYRYKCGQQDIWMKGRLDQLAVSVGKMEMTEVLASKKKLIAYRTEMSPREQRLEVISGLRDKLEELRCPVMGEVNDMHTAIVRDWAELKKEAEQYSDRLDEREAVLLVIDEFKLTFARKAPEVKAFLDDSIEDVADTYQANSVQETEDLLRTHNEFVNSMAHWEAKLTELKELNAKILQSTNVPNPYTAITVSELHEKWAQLEALVDQRAEELKGEKERQISNEQIMKEFAELASRIDAFRVDSIGRIQQSAIGTGYSRFEESIEALKVISNEVEAFYKGALMELECVNKKLDASKIFHNPFSAHTVESLGTDYQHLMEVLSNNINEVENQILVRDSSNLTEQQVKDHRKAFDHFDRHGVGYLSPEDFRSFLVSQAFHVTPNDSAGDKEFGRIMGLVDPKKTDKCTFPDFLNFAAAESKYSDTAEQVIESFKVIAGGKDYITTDAIRKEFSPEHAEAVIKKMAPSTVPGAPPGSLDYRTFAATLYGETDL